LEFPLICVVEIKKEPKLLLFLEKEEDAIFATAGPRGPSGTGFQTVNLPPLLLQNFFEHFTREFIKHLAECEHFAENL